MRLKCADLIVDILIEDHQRRDNLPPVVIKHEPLVELLFKSFLSQVEADVNVVEV